MRSITALFFILFVTRSIDGFFPNNYKLLLNENDYTCADLSQIGILRAVANYFDNKPPNGPNSLTGELANLTDITPRLLYDRYYGELSSKSTRHIQEAISVIIKANNMADLDHNDDPEWTFNAEKIDEANVRLILLRQQILKYLQQSPPNYDVIRHLIGQALYMIQQFYSNTNWVEMYGETINQDLGIRPLMTVAPSNLDTCKDCQQGNCTNNILVNDQLTSGYKSGQNVDKPSKNPHAHTGKCSHGGEFDTTSNSSAATGGINKDSSQPSLSPHYYLHHTAAMAAIKHTEWFFSHSRYGLRSIVGDDKFEEILQLQTTNSLVFVIDTTSSMASVINTVKSKTIELVSHSVKTGTKPYKYILVEFLDSAQQYRVRITKNSDVMICWLSSLKVEDGGDCPDFSLTGIQKGAEAANPNSNMYVFTDSNPKDSEKFSYVESIIRIKKIIVDFIITDQCSRNKRSEGPQKRSTSQLTEYHRLAKVSGGQIFDWSIYSIDNLLSDVIEESVKSRESSVLSTKMPSNVKEISIDFDMTMQAINIFVSSSQQYIRPILYHPDGNMELFDDSVKTTFRDVSDRKVYMRINKPTDGIWRLVKLDYSSWTIEVTSETLFLWDIHLLQQGNNRVTEYDIKGNPLAGENIPVVFEVLDQLDSIGSISEFAYLDENGNDMYNRRFAIASSGTGNFKKYFRAELSIPTKPFYIKIFGTDKHGNIIQYQHPQLIVPSEIKLNVFKVTGTLSDSQPVSVWCELSNTGNQPVLPVSLSVNFDRESRRQSYSLVKGHNIKEVFSFFNDDSLNPMAIVSISPTASITGGQYELLWLSNDRNTVQTRHRRMTLQPSTTPIPQTPTRSPVDISDIKLLGKCVENDAEGLVMVRHINEWGLLGIYSVQSYSFNNSEAMVICRTLGYSYGIQKHFTTVNYHTKVFALPFKCNGTEISTTQCRKLPFGYTSHGYTGVSCYDKPLQVDSGETTAPPLSSDCRDDESVNCGDYTKAQLCPINSVYHYWALLHCKKFCGYCISTPPLQVNTTAISTTAVPTNAPNTCQDHSDMDCTQYQKDKRICDTSSIYRHWAETNCKSTCGLCSDVLGDCTDVSETDCRLYNKTQICPADSIYHQWAVKNCGKFCGYCISTQPSPVCEDKLPNCAEYQSNMCTDHFYQIFRETNCRNYCKLC